MFLESGIGEEYSVIEACNQRAVVNQFIALTMKKQDQGKLQQQSTP